jgi:hypothetical protein
MKRLLLAVALFAVGTNALGAQPMQETLRLGAVPAPVDPPADRAPLSSGFVVKQYLSATGGMLVLGIAGGLIGGSTASSSDGFAEIGQAALGALAGGVLGSALGVQWYSKRHGHESPFLASLVGAAVGVAGIAAGWPVLVTMPVGGVVGYNVARR